MRIQHKYVLTPILLFLLLPINRLQNSNNVIVYNNNNTILQNSNNRTSNIQQQRHRSIVSDIDDYKQVPFQQYSTESVDRYDLLTKKSSWGPSNNRGRGMQLMWK